MSYFFNFEDYQNLLSKIDNNNTLGTIGYMIGIE
jgi:hypothetical protein